MGPANDNARPRTAREALSEALAHANHLGEAGIAADLRAQLAPLGGPVAFATTLASDAPEDRLHALARCVAEGGAA